MRRVLPLLALAAGCGGSDSAPDAAPTANAMREILDTQLHFDVTAMTATATITFGPSTMTGGSLEIGDLAIDSVLHGTTAVPFTTGGKALLLALPATTEPYTIDIAYRWMTHESFQGASRNGYTLIWPYYCGNLFPCHSQPADGTTFTLDVTGVPAGKTAVFPTAIPADAPAYQIAWAINAFTQTDFGTTTAGTLVSIWHGPNELAHAQIGGAHLVAAFDWLEQTLGPYRFGNHVGTISVNWPPGAFGGMEHHPFWHVGGAALSSEETNVHESAHGWFGDGIRIQCWEDFVLSEGTVSYLAARALDVVAPSVGAATWADYQTQLATIPGTDPVWPQSCGTVDVINDNLFTQAPYMRGAFFYKAIADKVGATLVDQALATFYQAHAGGAARMTDMLDTLHTVTGYDPTACAQIWLLDPTTPTPAPCP